MGKFFLKSFLFFVVSLLLIFLVRLPFKSYWELKKITRVTDLVNDFNGFFLGSSLGMKHIDPKLFDEVVGPESNTLNLAVAGCTMPESFNAYYQLLDRLDRTEETKYVFFELQQVRTIPDFNLGTSRTINMVNGENYLVSLKYLLSKGRHKDIYNYSHPFIQNVTGVNTISDILKEKYMDMERGRPDPTGKMPRAKGYVPNKVPLKMVQETKWSEVRKEKVTGTLDRGDKVLINKINKMIEDGKEKNVHLICYFAVGISELENLKYGLDEDHLIDLAQEYDIFYDDFGLWKNPTHMNYKGAEIFTKMLAEAFQKDFK